MSNESNERKELKVLLSNFDLSLIDSYIRLTPYLFEKKFDNRYVNSIYYDSFDFECLQDNLSSISRRYKKRLRWYGDINQTNFSNLEFKIKEGVIGKKIQIPINQFISFKDSFHSNINSILSQNIPENKFLLFDYNCFPVVLVRYKRLYYESLINKIRITVDSDIQFYTQLNSNNINITIKKRPEYLKIIEIKFNNNLDYLTQDLMQYLPFRVTKSSKYTMAVQSIYL